MTHSVLQTLLKMPFERNIVEISPWSNEVYFIYFFTYFLFFKVKFKSGKIDKAKFPY